jgi:hypothetical protein
MSLAYRGLEYAAERRWTDAAVALSESHAPAAYERRVGRIAGGIVGTAAGIFTFSAALGFSALDPLAPVEAPDMPAWHGRSFVLALTLVFAGVAAVAAYVLGRAFARVLARRVVSRAAVRSGDAVRDFVALEHDAPGQVLERRARALEYRSVLFPMVALSLLAPLTLHALVAGLIGDFASFGSWMSASALIVGHAHLVLCICCIRYARIIRRSSAEDLLARGDRDWWRALGFTTAAAAIPGVMLLAVPPVLTLVTGLVFIPAMFRTIRSHVLEERAALATLA